MCPSQESQRLKIPLPGPLPLSRVVILRQNGLEHPTTRLSFSSYKTNLLWGQGSEWPTQLNARVTVHKDPGSSPPAPTCKKKVSQAVKRCCMYLSLFLSAPSLNFLSLSKKLNCFFKKKVSLLKVSSRSTDHSRKGKKESMSTQSADSQQNQKNFAHTHAPQVEPVHWACFQ